MDLSSSSLLYPPSIHFRGPLQTSEGRAIAQVHSFETSLSRTGRLLLGASSGHQHDNQKRNKAQGGARTRREQSRPNAIQCVCALD